MEGVPHVPSLCGTLCNEPPRDAALARLAQRQYGVVSLTQLRALGLSASGVRSRVATGRLHRLHRGVYAVGHPRLTHHGRWMAAVLTYGPEAVLSHRSAADLWGIRPSASARIEVSVPRPARARIGIDVHRSATLGATDLTSEDAIPCTSVARTLLDLAEVLDRRGVERAVEQAERLRLFDLRAVDEMIARANGHRGSGVLRSVLDELNDPGPTASEFEEGFLALCRRAALPQPRVNAWIVLDDRAVKADFLWPAQRLAIETDGHDFHSGRAAFERDRARDQRLTVAGYRVVRFTWRQLVGEPERVAATVRTLLAR